jgi:hypothetical protein
MCTGVVRQSLAMACKFSIAAAIGVVAPVVGEVGVLAGLQVWLAVQVRRPFLYADVCARRMRDQSGLDG